METKQDKKLTLKDIEPYSERWNNIKRAVEKRVDSDFNFQQFDNVKQVLTGEEEGYIGESIIEPDARFQVEHYIDSYNYDDSLKKEFEEIWKEDSEEDYTEEDFIEWVKDNKHNEISDAWMEREHYPMWNTLFEARDEFLSEKIMDNVDKIYEITGAGVIDGGERFNNMIFMTSAGHDFYEAYWVKLYCEVFEWVDVNNFEGDIKNK
jgi:hypothetical protein